MSWVFLAFEVKAAKPWVMKMSEKKLCFRELAWIGNDDYRHKYIILMVFIMELHWFILRNWFQLLNALRLQVITATLLNAKIIF